MRSRCGAPKTGHPATALPDGRTMRVSPGMRHAHVAGCSHIAARCQAARRENPRPRRRPAGPFARPSRFPADERGSQLHAASPAATQASSCTCVRRCESAPQICGGPSGVASATLARVGPTCRDAFATRQDPAPALRGSGRYRSSKRRADASPAALRSTTNHLRRPRPGSCCRTEENVQENGTAPILRPAGLHAGAAHPGALRSTRYGASRNQSRGCKTKPGLAAGFLPEWNCHRCDISTWRRPEPEPTRSDSSSRRGRCCP